MPATNFHTLAALLVLAIIAAAPAAQAAEPDERAAAEARLRAEIESLRAELSETRRMIDQADSEVRTLRGQALDRRGETLLERWRAERDLTVAERRRLHRERGLLDRSHDALDRALEVERRRAEARRLLADQPVHPHADPRFIPRDFARRYGSIYPHATFSGFHLLHPRLRFGHVTHLSFTRFRHLHLHDFQHRRFDLRRPIRTPAADFTTEVRPGSRHGGSGAFRLTAPGHLSGGIIRTEPAPTIRLRTPGPATSIEPRMVTPAQPRGSIRSRD